MLFRKKSKSDDLKKRASVYISDEHKHLVIAARSQNDAGIIYEQEVCCLLEMPVDLSELGVAIIDYLNRYSVVDINLRDHKNRDWPAYKKSKSKSMRLFEQEYIYISIDGANEKNIILLISGRPFKNSKLEVHSSVSFYAEKEEIGNRVMDVYEACLTGKIF